MDKYSQQNTELKVLELFAGNRSFGKICDSYGIKTCSTDLYQCKEKNIHMVKNFLEMKIEDIPFIPDVIWASPPCTAFSVASSGHHFGKDKKPKTEAAIEGLLLLKKTISWIRIYQKINPKLIWFIENPRGLMRKNILMKNMEFYRRTLCYCQYGFAYQKPTDIWTNMINWIPRTMCSPGSPCHKSAPRNSQGGLLSISKSKRSLIPGKLFEEILSYII